MTNKTVIVITAVLAALAIALYAFGIITTAVILGGVGASLFVVSGVLALRGEGSKVDNFAIGGMMFFIAAFFLYLTSMFMK